MFNKFIRMKEWFTAFYQVDKHKDVDLNKILFILILWNIKINKLSWFFSKYRIFSYGKFYLILLGKWLCPFEPGLGGVKIPLLCCATIKFTSRIKILLIILKKKHKICPLHFIDISFKENVREIKRRKTKINLDWFTLKVDFRSK